MKTKCSFILKSSIALILSVLMIFGSLSTVLAATVDVAANGYYWDGGTYYMKGSFNNWGNLSGTNNSSNKKQHYYYIYTNGSSTNADITFKFKEENGSGNDSWFGAGDTNSIGTSGKQIYENGGENIHLNRKNLGTTSTTWYKVKVWFEHQSNCYCWYEKETTKTALTPTITTKKGSTSTTDFKVGDTVSLSTATTNNFGTVTYTYRYKKGSGSWNDISGTSFSPTSAGTYTIEVTANDGAVVSGTNSESARTATATKEITVTAASCDYYTHVMWRDFGGTTYTPDETYGSVPRNTSTAPTADIGSLATSNTFDGWYVGDNGTATSTTGLTKYPDNSSYTNSSISIAYNTSVKHYYAFLTRPEPSYSVTVAKGTGGNVASTSVTAHPSTKVTLPKATPSDGYRFKNWTATTGITITNAESASAAQITATGSGGTVTANFEAIPGTTIYIKKTMPTFTHFYAWNGANTTAVTAAWPGDKFTSWSTTSDGKYYYKTYTWNCSTFKFILNNGGDSSKTTDSVAYDTGKSYYIDSATAGQAAVLTEGVPQASTITYPTGNFTIDGTKPASAYTGETVSFTVTAADGYRIDKVQYTPAGGSATNATAGTNNEYHFTMPDKNVTVSVSVKKQYEVTLTAGTGFATRKYKVGSGTQQSFTSTTKITVDEGATVVIDVTYTAGYEYDSTSSLDGAVASNSNQTFTLSNITANKTVTLKAKKINYTITYPATTTGYTLGSNNPTTATYNSNVSFTVTPQTGYRIDEVKYNSTKITGSNNTYSFSMPAADVTIAVTASKVNTVKAVTNKSSRGTVTVDKDTAAKGDTVKITVTPLAGTLKTLTATYGNGKVYEYKNSNWTEVTSSGSNAAPASTSAKPDIAAIGAEYALVAVGATQTINMVMQEDSSVTINATFDTYSADSTWYYNGYDTSGNAVSGYHGKQMTESMVSGEKFSYYHVEGRTGTDQLMTVSNGAASSGTRYVYFTVSNNGGWSTDANSQYAYFYNESGAEGKTWPGYKMTKYTTNDYGQDVYRVEIPTSSSPTKVIFNNGSTAKHQTTDVTDLSKGGYYLLTTTHSEDGKTIHDWQSYDCTYPSAGYSTGTEYFYDSTDSNVSTIYSTDSNGKSIFNTTGFYRHGTNNKNYAKPNGAGSDYYINVLYPGKTYTINGVTKTIGNDGPVVIWSAEPLAGDDENVTVYAKDGAIRAETFGATYANIADTKIYLNNTVVGTNHSGNITNQTYQTYKAAKGDTLVIKTQIGATDSGNLSNAADLKAKYYVRGFCVNGEVSELLEWNEDGLYTLTYKIPEDTEITKFEITPIYYLKDTTANPIVTYRVTGFTDELKQVGAGKPGWGDTLYTYPYYGKLGGDSNAFGAYPGQPMVYYKGQYQMQIPQKSTTWVNTTSSNTTVSGVTMSNGYWDSVHKSIMGYGDNSTSADHVQTYDYGDFYKIFNEKKPVDNIVFDFKYRTKKHNLVNDNTSTSIAASTLTSAYGTNGNGFELLTNFHGKNVDLFGNPLSGDAANPSKTTPIYVVSIGGVNENGNPQYGVENIAGYYATEWRVYAPNTLTSLTSTYKKVTVGNKSSIPPEVLVLNNDDTTSFNTSTYPSADANHNVTDWKAMYTELKKYAGHPVMISYEAADAQQGQGMYYTGTGGATRNDGRWLYSKNGENITSKIKIQYSDDNGATYTDLNTTTPQVTGLSAYFTNDGVEGQMTYSTTIDPDKTFDFEAKTTNGEYKFVGWYMEDGTKITSDNASHTERSGSYTFVAKFMQVQGGQLILSHSADKGTIGGTDYQGAGTAKISAVVKDGEEVIRTYDLSTSDITLDDKIIKSDSTYTIEVTLEATATGNDNLGTTVLANPSGQDSTYFSEKSSSTSGKTKTIVLNSFTVASLFTGTTQNVKNIIYHSYFAATTFHYKLVFEYKDRNGDTKQFYRSGFLTAAQAANPNYVDVIPTSPTSNERRLMPAFIETVAPHISNFAQEDVEWDIASTGYQFSVMNYKYTLERAIVTRQRDNDKKNVTFVLPYAHTDGIATGGNAGTADTTTNFELTGDNAVTFDTIPVLLNDAENGIYTEEGKKNWIAAPATLDDNGTTKYFQYWSVKSTAADKDTDPEVARCYFQGFNFCALDNYIVTPIYEDQPTDISNSGIYTGASFLETSRNQWNGNATTEEIDHYTVDPTTGRKKASAADRAAAADLLYNDFILNYNYKGVDIYKGNSDSDDIKELGVVVERVKELDINQDGSKITDVSHYASVEQNLDTINGIINGTVSTSSKYMKDTVAKTALDNKNRIKFYEAFYNGAGWVKDNQDYASKYTYKNYVYRAYTYIKYKDAQGNDQIELSVPAYFTMYDEATANYVAPTTNTSGN